MENFLQYDDKLLLELLSKNNEFAFSEIYDRYWQKIFGIAYNRLHEIETAEDIVHDVFASLWANKNKSDIISLENYLASAAKYLVLAKIKRKERERNFIAAAETPVIQMNIENSLHYKQVLEFVKNEVEKLPEKCRLVFTCSRVEYKPNKQIAQELNISQKTVENQLNKALRHLRVATKGFVQLLFIILHQLFSAG